MKFTHAGKIFCTIFLVVSLTGASGARIARQQKAEKKSLRKDLITLRRCGHFRITQGSLSPELMERCADTYQRLGLKLFPDHNSSERDQDSNAFSSSSYSSVSSSLPTPRPSASSSSVSSSIPTPRPSSSSSSFSSVVMTPKPGASSSSASSISYFTPTPVRTATSVPTVRTPLATSTPIRTATPFPSYPTMPTYAPTQFPVATYQITMAPAGPSITPPTSDGTIDEPIA